MKRSSILLVVLLLAIACEAKAVAPPLRGGQKKDSEALQGTWTMVFAATSGRALVPEEIAGIHLVVKGDKYTLFKEEDKIHDHGTLVLDPKASPRAIDIIEDQGPNKGTSNRGIYLLDGDTFMVCYNLPHMKRPVEFTSKADGTIFLFIYKRAR